MRSQGFLWSVRNATGIVDGDTQGIHISNNVGKGTKFHASAETVLDLRSAALWKLTFAVQFGKLETVGATLAIRSKDGIVAQLSADSAQNGFTAFIAGAENRFARKYDADWHRFDVIGIDKWASLWMDGEQIGEGPIPGIPDKLSIGPSSQTDGAQTEIWVRGLTVEPSAASQYVVNLFNGTDLTGWFLGGPPYRVEGGVIKSIGGREPDYAGFIASVPVDAFVFSIRVRMLDGVRLRIFVMHEPILLANLSGIYIGMEGDGKSISLFGRDLENVKTHTNAAYKYGEWYDLRLEVGQDDNVVLLMNGEVTHTAHRVRKSPVWIAVCAGDGFSPGHVEVASVKFSSVPLKSR